MKRIITLVAVLILIIYSDLFAKNQIKVVKVLNEKFVVDVGSILGVKIGDIYDIYKGELKIGVAKVYKCLENFSGLEIINIAPGYVVEEGDRVEKLKKSGIEKINNNSSENIPPSSFGLSLTYFAPGNTDIENYAYGGLKGSFNIWMDNSREWSLFGEYKGSKLEATSYSQKVTATIGFLSIGAGFRNYMVNENLYVGSELYYAKISVMDDNSNDRETLGGFGYALKIGVGGLTSPNIYIYFEGKYNWVELKNDNGLEGLGFDFGGQFYF